MKSLERGRRIASAALCDSPAVRWIGGRTEGRLTIFLLHRLIDPALGNPGDHGVDELADLLRWLRRWDFEVTDLDDGLARLAGDGRPLRRSVCFTADDGYQDQTRMAELFIEHGAPLTIFLTTGFLDEELLPWWDGLAWMVDRASDGLRVDLTAHGGGRWLLDDESRPALKRQVTARCKKVPEATKQAILADLSDQTRVTPPTEPAGTSLPMTWSDVRRLESSGLISFGAHTVTHPILANVDDERANQEIVHSRRRLSDEVARFSGAFCYPNGERADFGDREVALVREAGFTGGVAVAYDVARCGTDPYRIPRFPLTDDPAQNKRVAAGAVRHHRMGDVAG